jgi:hypothetical protein
VSVSESNLKDARDQLAMILSFFPRVDAKLSTILAVNTAMMATLSASVPVLQKVAWWMAIAPAIATVMVAVSFVYLYRGGFPDLKGGHESVVYFKEIAKRTESKFIEQYENQTSESLRKDVLAQVWRNAEILSQKFHSLRMAFVWMALAAIPWSISLAIFALQRANLQVSVTHP